MSMKHLQDVGTGKATLTEEQVQIVCCLLMRAIQLLLWMMDRPMLAPHKHEPKGKRLGQGVLASETREFLADLRRVLSGNTLLGTPTVVPDEVLDAQQHLQDMGVEVPPDEIAERQRCNALRHDPDCGEGIESGEDVPGPNYLPDPDLDPDWSIDHETPDPTDLQ